MTTTSDIFIAPPELVLIPATEFLMGHNATRKDEAPAHAVRIDAFRAAVAPVTNADYARFIEATGHDAPPFLGEERFAAPEQPVVGISWLDASAYCQWLSRETGIAFRLPTEAERELASLGGLSGVDWPWGEGAHPLETTIAALDRPHAPTADCANGYGLRCMAENVHEWCADWYAPGYYRESPVDNPRGPRTGKRRVSRGGSWRHSVKFTRLTARASLGPEMRYNDFGFRVYADA